MTAPTTEPATYPPSPWALRGQLWLSLFRVPSGSDPLHPDRPAGLYGVALVSYEDPSPLVYRELLCARPVGTRAGITDIWVDSPASRAGGRDLWAIPKELATFRHTSRGRAGRHGTWEIGDDAQVWATAEVTDTGPRTPRLPFGFRTRQVRDDGSVVVTPVRGTARLSRSRARWHAHDEGPLAWLAGVRPQVTFRAADFAMEFGRSGE